MIQIKAVFPLLINDFAAPNLGGKKRRGGNTREKLRNGTATAADILGLVATQGGTLSSGGQQSSPLVTALDADADGTISAAEIASAPQSLRTLDNDGDGALSSSELSPAPASLPE